ncbi:hypothetical protein ZOSMA_77G00920 [Zostera marina]|uniref:Uncharacterized protein n=1 Tax=Zostera marina TaxID=29655 RepID=A0A0K9NR21_ZOSMR|nr:hypothetical protein ZOSMA_77G00920 [Zostera marina]
MITESLITDCDSSRVINRDFFTSSCDISKIDRDFFRQLTIATSSGRTAHVFSGIGRRSSSQSQIFDFRLSTGRVCLSCAKIQEFQNIAFYICDFQSTHFDRDFQSIKSGDCK